MKKAILFIIIVIAIPIMSKAQFNFHWAFPYFAVQHMSVKNGNTNYLILTKNEKYNGFPAVTNKSYWDKNSVFFYERTESKVKINSYIFVAVDGTINISEIESLDAKLPKNVIFFIHRTGQQWINDVNILSEILKTRPGWAYGGNPYEPETPILRSGKDIFTKNGIILGNQAPGEGLSKTAGK